MKGRVVLSDVKDLLAPERGKSRSFGRYASQDDARFCA